jgi:sortase A
MAAAGCGGGTGQTYRPQAQAQAQATAPAAPVSTLVVHPSAAPAMTVVPAGPPVVLPEPINIPDNSYAPEPVTQIGTMEIPKLKLVHPVYDGVTLNNIDLGPSHWPGTAEPGQVGNTVFAGHRVTHDSPFRHLDRLEVGDQVVFDVHGVRSSYHVTASMVVEAADSWISDQTPTPTGTLYACHPPGSVDQRYVVRLALDS